MSCKNPLRHSLKLGAMSALFEEAVSGLYPIPPCKSFGVGLCCRYSSFEDHNKANGLSCKKEPGAEPHSTSIKPIETSLRLFLSPTCSHPSSYPIFLFSREEPWKHNEARGSASLGEKKTLKPPLVMFANLPLHHSTCHRKNWTSKCTLGRFFSLSLFFLIPSILLGFLTSTRPKRNPALRVI